MKKNLILALFSAFLAIPCALVAKVPAYEDPDDENDIKAIFRRNKCVSCHGGPRAKGSFRLDRASSILEHIGEGDDKGEVIIPGNANGSKLVHLITDRNPDSRMPQKGRSMESPPPVSATDVEKIKLWINTGVKMKASDPDPEMAQSTTTPAAPEGDAPDPKALHEWISVSGTKIQAYFVRVDGPNLVLKSESGEEKSFPAKVLSPASIELAKKLAQAN